MNERKKAEIRENNELNENNEITDVIGELEQFIIFNIQMTNIVNDQNSDYHIHSVFSDGCATIEEIVQYA